LLFQTRLPELGVQKKGYFTPPFGERTNNEISKLGAIAIAPSVFTRTQLPIAPPKIFSFSFDWQNYLEPKFIDEQDDSPELPCL